VTDFVPRLAETNLELQNWHSD